MAELGTGLAILGAALGSKEIIIKILGPTADYVGNEIKLFTGKNIQNLKKIFQIAAERLGARLEERGTVPPRVFKEVIFDGSFCEDELLAEYWGGILASSRTATERDDRAVSMINIVKSLSTYQIRTHYILYHIFRRLFIDSGIHISSQTDAVEAYIPYDVYLTAMDFSKNEDANNIMGHSFIGLNERGLINFIKMGSAEFLRDLCLYETRVIKNKYKVDKGGIFVGASILGTELFLWANGVPNVHVNLLLSKDIEIKTIGEIYIRDGSRKLADLKTDKP